jgi:hypothetical protein
MQKRIIERAYELAAECTSVEDVRLRLKQEGYSNVEMHFQGSLLRRALTKLLKPLSPGEKQKKWYP